MLTLVNKTSIITGASSGIGKATAILFSQLGSKLVLVGRDESALDQTITLCNPELKNDIIKVSGDLCNSDTCKKIVEQAVNKFGTINILVNAAGILKAGSLENMKMEDYDLSMDTNVKSAMILTQLCLPYLIKEKGSVVNVSSVTGTRSFPGVLPYCISKAALDQFTKCVALEVADKGVRVNSVNPGVIVTNLHRRAGQSEEVYAKFLENCKNTHALGRPGTGEEVARTIAFLASDNASFITGELVHVDGGRHAMTPR
ncbi:3-oxoacyl-[acyl-carrier- ] reductase -like [Brachionus plicatilis]|uniref:3-oxoacyl-[acyl-carrier-] reductase-like n=1 Tax=Brachionus plicatilis TaxID=10195 RepID=A0A3M7RFY1_BRAPC|nr:3-oxoacyl-[acyl-carrier- ] reductase -like [Brachionus plicatilis]